MIVLPNMEIGCRFFLLLQNSIRFASPFPRALRSAFTKLIARLARLA